MSAALLTSGFSSGFSGLLFSGSSSSSEQVPQLFDVAVNGRAFRLDTHQQGQFQHRRESNAALRQQSDQGATPGEQSISRDDLWRRSQADWSHGAGQTFFDRPDSDSSMFLSSRRVDVWDRWEAKLLPTTDLVESSSNTNLRLTQAAQFIYMIDGQLTKLCLDPSAGFSTAVGTPAVDAEWITSDGFYVYVAYGTSGVYRSPASTASFTQLNVGSASNVSYVKGRVMTSYGPSIFNITDFGVTTAPTALLTHANSDWQWVGFAEGPSHIFAAGFSGNHSLIYRIGLTPDGTSLDAPVVAGELPLGEIAFTVHGYLGFLLIGTSLGVRLASIDGNGNLVLGALIRTPLPVRNFQPGDRFVWFGWSNIDATATGLGRLDLSVFTAPLLPAYACDLEAEGQGEVTSIATYVGDKRVFTVAGLGLFLESDTLCDSGEIVGSRITYDIADDKVARFIDLRTEPLVGSVSTTLLTPLTQVTLATFEGDGLVRPDRPLNAQQLREEWFTVVLTLNRDVDTNASPTVTRVTLRAYPAPPRSFTMTVPLLLSDEGENRMGDPVFSDTADDREFLEALVRSQQLITYQEDGQTFTVLCDDSVWLPTHDPDAVSEPREARNGTFVLMLRETSE